MPKVTKSHWVLVNVNQNWEKEGGGKEELGPVGEGKENKTHQFERNEQKEAKSY